MGMLVRNKTVITIALINDQKILSVIKIEFIVRVNKKL